MTENKEITLELSEKSYKRLKEIELEIKTINPEGELSTIQFHTIVPTNSGRFSIMYIKDVSEKENKFYANAQVQVTVDTHEEAASILSALRKDLEDKGIRTKGK